MDAATSTIIAVGLFGLMALAFAMIGTDPEQRLRLRSRAPRRRQTSMFMKTFIMISRLVGEGRAFSRCRRSHPETRV